MPITDTSPSVGSLGTQPNGLNTAGADELAFTPGPLRLRGRPATGPVFNTSLFSLPALGTFGNARRRFFHSPGSDNTDLALEKSTTLLDGGELELGAEAFNAFNHAHFFGPASVEGNIGSAAFGQIVSASAPRLMQVSARFRWQVNARPAEQQRGYRVARRRSQIQGLGQRGQLRFVY